MKIKRGTMWQRKGAPELRVVIDLVAGLGVRYTVVSTGLRQNVTRFTFRRQFEPANN